jgi:hypothetical protein
LAARARPVIVGGGFCQRSRQTRWREAESEFGLRCLENGERDGGTLLRRLSSGSQPGWPPLLQQDQRPG